MIKKAVLTLSIAPFLMVFSSESYAWTSLGTNSGGNADCNWNNTGYKTWCKTVCRIDSDGSCAATASDDAYNLVYPTVERLIGDDNVYYIRRYISSDRPFNYFHARIYRDSPAAFSFPPGGETVYNHTYTDAQCQSQNGGSGTRTVSEEQSYGYPASGGACTVKATGATVCLIASEHQPAQCSSTWVAESTGQVATPSSGGATDSPGAPTEFNVPDYLNALPGECTASSCVQIGDTAYLVDWDTAPDWFEYTDANGNTISGPSGGDPTDPGGDNGGGDTGGDPDDGSTVPDFEFDESGVIEAIGSAGQSNQNAINSLSNDVTGAISSQTNTLTDSLTDQTTDLTTATTNQTEALTDSLDDQTTDVTDAIGDQTGSLNSKLGDLQTAIVDGMKNITVRVSGGGGGSSGGSDGEGDGEGDGFLDTLIDKLASLFDTKFEEAANSSELPGDADTAGMINGEGVADEVIDSLEQDVEEQNTAIYDEFEGIFEGGGIIDGALSPLRDFVTSFLPSLPTGGCTPLVFGAGERSFTIDCEGFNLLKAALSWVLFFFTAYQLISIPMDARKA